MRRALAALQRRGRSSRALGRDADRILPSPHQRPRAAGGGGAAGLDVAGLRPRHPARRGAVLSLIFILTEAAVGAGLVLFELVADNATMARAMFMAAHLVNTFLLVAVLTLTAWWLSGGGPLAPSRRPAVALAWAALAAGLLLSGVSGAVAALGDTLYPAASHAEGLAATLSPSSHLLLRLRALHPVIAVSAGVLLMFAAPRLAARRRRPGQLLGRATLMLAGAPVARRPAQPPAAGARVDADRAPARRRPVVDCICPAGRADACRGTRSRHGPYHHTVTMHRRVAVRRVCQALLVALVACVDRTSARSRPFRPRPGSGRRAGRPAATRRLHRRPRSRRKPTPTCGRRSA